MRTRQSLPIRLPHEFATSITVGSTPISRFSWSIPQPFFYPTGGGPVQGGSVLLRRFFREGGLNQTGVDTLPSVGPNFRGTSSSSGLQSNIVRYLGTNGAARKSRSDRCLSLKICVHHTAHS